VAHPRIPLIRLDAGWLFIIAGLVACIGCVLVSADTELQMLRVQKSLLQAQEQTAFARIRVHEDFLERLENPDDSLTRRLAATELNLMPMDDEPVLRLVSFELPTIEWVDRQVEPQIPRAVLANTSLLTKFATGPNRLWLFGGGMMCVFIGLLLDPSASRVRQRLRTMPVEDANAIQSEGPVVATALLEPEAAAPVAFVSSEDATSPGAAYTAFETDSAVHAASEEEEIDDEVCVDNAAISADDEVEDEFELDASEDDVEEEEGDVETDDETDVEELDEDDVEVVDAVENAELLISDVEALETEDEAEELEEVEEVEDFEKEEAAETVVEVKSIAAPATSVLSIRPPEIDATNESEDELLFESSANEASSPDLVLDDDAMETDEFDAIDDAPDEDWDADVPPDDFADEVAADSPRKRRDRSPRRR